MKRPDSHPLWDGVEAAFVAPEPVAPVLPSEHLVVFAEHVVRDARSAWERTRGVLSRPVVMDTLRRRQRVALVLVQMSYVEEERECAAVRS